MLAKPQPCLKGEATGYLTKSGEQIPKHSFHSETGIILLKLERVISADMQHNS
jgi:hypothetical protein